MAKFEVGEKVLFNGLRVEVVVSTPDTEGDIVVMCNGRYYLHSVDRVQKIPCPRSIGGVVWEDVGYRPAKAGEWLLFEGEVVYTSRGSLRSRSILKPVALV